MRRLLLLISLMPQEEISSFGGEAFEVRILKGAQCVCVCVFSLVLKTVFDFYLF